MLEGIGIVKTFESMEFTGERFVPEVHGVIELEHLHRYRQACRFAAGKAILDLASGEGYGAAMLARTAAKVIGVDSSADSVAHASHRYHRDNLEYMVGTCADIPLPNACIDVVVSFETIEHHDRHEQMMQEVRRVLRPDGILVISTPDKYHYSIEPGRVNPYHVKELYQHEFKQLLGNHFKHIVYFGQRVFYGSGIFPESMPMAFESYAHGQDIAKASPGMRNPDYWIAVASDCSLPDLVSSVLEQRLDDSLRQNVANGDEQIREARKATQLSLLNSLVRSASFSADSLQFPNSWVGLLPFAAWLIQEVSPNMFVELGTHSGNSYFSFCQAVAQAGLSSRCYAVDTWRGDEHAGEYGEEIFAAVSAHHEEHFAQFSRLMRMTFDEAAGYFPDQSIDLLHIDGLHTYDAVRHDFETWLPKLAPGAVVLIHDTNVRERNFGVWRLWEELRERYPNNLEFVHSHGLGVLQLSDAPDSRKMKWLEPDSPEKQAIASYFTSLGVRQLERYEFKQRVDGYQRVVSECDEQIVGLTRGILDRDRQIAGREAQIISLSQTVSGRDAHIAVLTEAVAERDAHIASLTQVAAERDAHIALIVSSNSWRVTLPLRELRRFTAQPALRARLYVKTGLGVTKRALRSLPVSREMKVASRKALAKYVPRLVALADSIGSRNQPSKGATTKRDSSRLFDVQW